jgi:ferredoxin-nitrite reductase
LLSEFVTCPGLFYATPAQDGKLSRIRIPGGMLAAQQSEMIAQLSEQFGEGYVQITNRANLQLRQIQISLSEEALARLQTLGLASPVAEVDAIRNIMGSPTAGIDRQQLLDTRPLVVAWNHYLISRPDLAVLSPKFSVCFDGGETVSVRDRPNDISLVAVRVGGSVYFQLRLSLGERGDAPEAVGILIKPEKSIGVLAALAEIYRDYIIQQQEPSMRRKPRFRDVLNDLGLAACLQAVEHHLPFSCVQDEMLDVVSYPAAYAHLGTHAQQQAGFSYIGVVLPLGRLNAQQLQGLATVAQKYGNGILRLTPWQNVLVTDIPNQQIAEVQQQIKQLGLDVSATHPAGAIVACSGKSGCAASATHTQAHALALTAYLEQHITLDRPVNIHLSGCEKSCAQHHSSDITLLGMATDGAETYRVYVGRGISFGRELYQNYAPEALPNLIEQMIQAYQKQRIDINETFKEFVDRHSLCQLKQLFSHTRHPTESLISQ